MKLHRGRTLEHWCRERRGLLGAESGNDILGGREQHVQPPCGGTEPGLLREIMETSVSLAHSEDR